MHQLRLYLPPQNQLRSGTHAVTPAQAASINDAGGNDRSQTTDGAVTFDQLTPVSITGVTASGSADIKLITICHGSLPTHHLGV